MNCFQCVESKDCGTLLESNCLVLCSGCADRILAQLAEAVEQRDKWKALAEKIMDLRDREAMHSLNFDPARVTPLS